MDDRNRKMLEPTEEVDRLLRNRTTLELCFISFVGIVVLSALVAALSYDLVSARAPLCIMVPLLILTGVQFGRTLKASRAHDVRRDLLQVFRGRSGEFNAVASFIGCMTLLLALIFVAGHYAGIAAFMFFLLRTLSGESLRLSATLSIGVTASIYFLFEHGFNIELYQGLILRLLSGYGM